MNNVRPLPVSAIAFFFVFGTLMSALSVMLLVFPGTLLDRVWSINPHGHAGLVQMGRSAVFLMVVVSISCATTAFGLWQLRRWGLLTAVAVLSINMMGDLLNAAFLNDYRALIGLPVGGAMIAYLIRRRRLFA